MDLKSGHLTYQIQLRQRPQNAELSKVKFILSHTAMTVNQNCNKCIIIKFCSASQMPWATSLGLQIEKERKKTFICCYLQQGGGNVFGLD